MNKRYISKSTQETITYAADIAKAFKAGDIIFLRGDLGAGKTTFVKGVAKALKAKVSDVCSPTFIVMNYYKGELPIFHFDLYRLEKMDEIQSLNLDEYFYGQGITLIEWPERLGSLAPEPTGLIELQHINEQQRKICVSYPLKHRAKHLG